MARNPYFRDYGGEQDVAEDLTIETIKTMGRDMVYIPRTIITKDDVFGEDVLSKFSDGYHLEMYIQSVDGFEGEGDILSKYGLQVKDRVELIVSRRRFEQEVTTANGLSRPKEGDLIYFPLSKSLFEIQFVEHENPFYQLGKLNVYKLSCELFSYDERQAIDTGIEDVDIVEDVRKEYVVKLTLGDRISGTSYVDYHEGESVFQISGATGGTADNATATATVIDWNRDTKVLKISDVQGTLVTGSSSESIKGSQSLAEYYVSAKETTNVITPIDPEFDNISGDNEELEYGIDFDDIFDFTETDPFSEGDY